MVSEFVHLHVHSDYSLLDGACAVKGLAQMAEEYKMPSVAITDHGFMGGSVEFYQTMTSHNIKPILGCEGYISPTNRFDRNSNNPDIRGFHILLLAANNKGYQNLCKLNARAFHEGFYFKPRIDKELLAEHSEGLIALSACLKGEIASAILRNNVKDAKKALGDFLDIFGRENFFLEMMDHGMPEQHQVNRELILLSKEFEVPLVATNDVHYLKQEHADAHELMLCIQTHSTVNDEKRMKLSSKDFYFKSYQEMLEKFRETPEALKNTLMVAERCNVELDFNTSHYPVFELPDGQNDRKHYLREICLDGIKERYDFDARTGNLTPEQQQIIDRMDMELGVIDNAGYCSYFLVVWDFINYAKREKGIPVGPGRGSGAGSIVAYLTKITGIDPLRYNLLFERFLNPERVSPPDFDIDFCERRRVEVIEYVRDKYGHESVAQIGTYGTLKTKAVLKDVARVLGHSFAEGDRITKLIGNDPKMTIEKAKEESKELRDLIAAEPWVAEVFKYAEPLEGLNRNMSIHAAGVIIGDQRLDNLVPLAKGASDEVITQFPAVPCEELGLLKMDFLGLRTLTIIQDAVEKVKKHRNVELDFEKIPLDDKETYKLLNRGDTVAVFQLESPGMRDLCRRFGVETIEHIIALIAIYRPGPMKYIPEFISRKMGQTKIEYYHPKMEPILNETYGIMLYQEQIMQAVQELAGFSLGQADILRRAIGKKKVKVMAEQREKFIQGCKEANNIPRETAEKIWEDIATFAGYGFNKSHSAAYAFLAYRTAYLKANYPVELMTAVLSSEINNADKIAFFINECREMDISILPPDVNGSDISFTVAESSIRFGLGAIKGVGSAAAEAIISSREQDGPFKSFNEFCERVGYQLNSRMLEHLIRAGAFDSMGNKRSQLVAVIEPAMSAAAGKAKDRASGQGSLFDMLDDSEQESFSVQLPDIPEFEENDMLKDEKEFLGFYVTGHPLAKHAEIIKTYSSISLKKVSDMPDNQGVRVGGIIKSLQRRVSKKNGNPYAIMLLEDLDGTMECMVYGKVYEEFQEMLEEDLPVFVEAITSKRDESEMLKLIAGKIIKLEKAKELYSKELHLHVYQGGTKPDELGQLRQICGSSPGPTRLILCVTCSEGEIAFIEAGEKHNVLVTDALLHQVQELLGENRYRLKATDDLPQPRRRYIPQKNNEDS